MINCDIQVQNQKGKDSDVFYEQIKYLSINNSLILVVTDFFQRKYYY